MGHSRFVSKKICFSKKFSKKVVFVSDSGIKTKERFLVEIENQNAFYYEN